MPELPEVEALALFVSEQAGGTTIERAELGSLSALKTYAPPLESLVGRKVAGAQAPGQVPLHTGRRTSGSWPTWPGRVGCTGATRCRRRSARPGEGPIGPAGGLVERGRVRPDRAGYGKKVGPVAGNRPRG